MTAEPVNREALALKYKPGDRLEAQEENGRWSPCVITKIAGYSGKSGPGYDAAFEPFRPNCQSFWTCDRFLRPRAEVKS